MPIHRDAPPFKTGVAMSLPPGEMGPNEGPVTIDKAFETSIRPCDATKKELPSSVKNKELKMATSGLKIDLEKQIDANTQNNLEIVNTPRNT